jgi:alpha-tubulin suppressor-like RCC1 family protein
LYDELGSNANGDTSSTPVAVNGLSGVTAIASGAAQLALLSNGTVMAWGINEYGQLGDGTTTASVTPVAVSGLSDVTAIAAGDSYSLALLSNGTVMAWGDNTAGELGQGTITGPQTCQYDGAGYACATTPVAVPGLSGAIAITAGFEYSLALLSNGTVIAWGTNNYGQLGDGTTTGPESCPNPNVGANVSCSPTPVVVGGLSDVAAVAAGGGDSLALLSDGTVMAWGLNDYGQLGNGTDTGPQACEYACNATPVAVNGLSEVTNIAAGYDHSLALLSDGTVMAWGLNDYGQLGDGTDTGPQMCQYACATTPIAVSGLSSVTAISAGADQSLALLSSGTVMAWGSNVYGQLGDDTVSLASAPTPVSGLSGVTAIFAGVESSFAIVAPSQTTPLTITTSLLQDATEGESYMDSLTAEGGTYSHTWTITNGALPMGLNFNPSNGYISGIPTSPGVSTFTVQVTDSSSPTPETATAEFSIVTHLLIYSDEIDTDSTDAYNGQVAYFLVHGSPPASIYSASVSWGDGSGSTSGTVTVVGGVFGKILRALGGSELVVTATHKYSSPSSSPAVISVIGPGATSGSTQDFVFFPISSQFFALPLNLSQGQIGLLWPVPATSQQPHVNSRTWTFSDEGQTFVDDGAHHYADWQLARALARDPTNCTLGATAVSAGMLPPEQLCAGPDYDSSLIQEDMHLWATYFPVHIVPHIFTKTGNDHITLAETGDAGGPPATSEQDFPVQTSCQPWEYWQIFGYDGCDLATGIALVSQTPQRAPDYYTFQIAGGKEFVSGGLSLTLTHNGDVFAGYGISGGPTLSVSPGSVSVAAGYVGSPGTDPLPDHEIDSFAGGWGSETDIVLGPFDMGFLIGLNGQIGEQYTLQGNLSIGDSAGVNCSIQIQGGVPYLKNIPNWDNGIGAGSLPPSSYVIQVLLAAFNAKKIASFVAGYVLTHLQEAAQCASFWGLL